jgi:methyl coenzyme M reductase alpha subunit
MLFYSLPGHLIFAPLTNKSLIMKKKVVVDHKTGITPTNYAAMEQKLAKAARVAIFAREEAMKQLDQKLRKNMTAQRIYEYSAALGQARALPSTRQKL